MKNLKKLISVIIAVIMLVSSFATVSAADYADVESTDSYYKAIKVLSGLGIAQGDDEGNFNPENDVKRSEMVAFVCRMMGENDIATASSSNAFTDVAANHWAAGYIAWGVNRGVINGMGDGTFAPDASVSYQDAVVMIMRALGYDRIAQRAENGGYPTGYLKLASQYGVLKDAGYDNAKAATREIIAQLIYNALTAPLVDVSYYGVDVEDDRYVIYNGKAGNDLRTLLTYANDIVKVKAEITKTPKDTPATCIDKNGNYMVEIDVEDAYDYPLASIKSILGITSGSKAVVYAGATEAAGLLGSTVEAYLAEDEDLGDWTLLAVIGDSKSVVEETLTENLDTIDVVNSTSGKIVKYYASLEDRKMTEIDIVASPAVYYNGVAIDATDLATAFTNLETLLNTYADEVKFMGAKNAAYDKIFVTDYTYYVVKSVNEAESLIKFDIGSLDLNAESRGNEDFIYNIYDAAGKEMDLADIAEGDVLNIVCPLDGTTVGNIHDVDFLDIYVTNETVTGKVDELLTSGKYRIDGEEYATTVGLTIGEEGVFYLSIDGKVVKKDASSVITKNFALYMGADVETKFGVSQYTVRLFTADGEIDAVIADTVKIIDGDGNATIAKSKNAGEQEAWFQADNTTTAADEAKGFEVYLKDATSEADAEANAKARFFTYRTNTAGEIIEIRLAGNASSELIAAIDKPAARYDAEFGEFGGYEVVDAKLFVAPVYNKSTTGNVWNINEDKLAIGNFASLDEDDAFNSYLYTVNGEDELAAVLMTDKPSYGLETSPLAVVAATGTKLDADDNQVTSYTIVQSGETKVVVKDYDIDAADDATLTVGDIFQYAVNAEEEIAEIELVYDAETRALSSYANGLTVNSDDLAFVFGAISEYADFITLMDDTDYSYTAGTPCTHAHDTACGYVAAVAGTECDAGDPATCDHSLCSYVAAVPEVPCTHAHDAACGYAAPVTVAGTGKAAHSAKFKVSEVEGATYAWYEEAVANNPVKKITINGVRETLRANAVYAAVVKLNENERAEDIVVIALNPSVFNSWDDIDNFGNWKLTY